MTAVDTADAGEGRPEPSPEAAAIMARYEMDTVIARPDCSCGFCQSTRDQQNLLRVLDNDREIWFTRHMATTTPTIITAIEIQPGQTVDFGVGVERGNPVVVRSAKTSIRQACGTILGYEVKVFYTRADGSKGNQKFWSTQKVTVL